jgi:cobalt/nickel transport system ATP-binding protein
MSVPVIAVNGLVFDYPDGRRALDGVDLHIHPGEQVALLGPNGAGKTTLALHLNGILLPRSGTVEVAGIPVAKEHFAEVRRRVGLVFQDPDDQVFMPTVREDVAFGPANLGLRGSKLDAQVEAALRAVGMEERRDRVPHHLSYGERRLVAIATVLAMEPEILVLDEPSANLDPMGRRELAEVLTRLGLTMLMVTHDLPYALSLCRRAVVMNQGRISGDGSIEEILSDQRLMAANRLELPYGFDPRIIARRPEGEPPT